MTGHKEDILSMDFQLPNCLATGSYDGEILLWNLDSQTLRTQNFRLVRPEIDAIPYSRRGVETLKFVTCRNRHNFILSSGGDMKIHVWNIERGTRVACTAPSHAGADAISCLEVNVPQQLMFTADNAGCVQTWDIAGFIEHRDHEPKPRHFAVAHSFRCHAAAITSLQYSPRTPSIKTAFRFRISSHALRQVHQQPHAAHHRQHGLHRGSLVHRRRACWPVWAP